MGNTLVVQSTWEPRPLDQGSLMCCATATADARRAFVAAAAATDEDEDAARASRSGVAHRVNMRESREEPTVRSRASRASVSRSRSRRRASMSDGASE